MKETEKKSSDPQLWQTCAGSMVQIPPLNSVVFYFPQDHAEHSQSTVNFSQRIPFLILCRHATVKFLSQLDGSHGTRSDSWWRGRVDMFHSQGQNREKIHCLIQRIVRQQDRHDLHRESRLRPQINLLSPTASLFARALVTPSRWSQW